MRSTVTVCDPGPGDKSRLGQRQLYFPATRLEREARRLGVSIEEFIRRLIREEHERSESHPKPSEAFSRYSGPEHGVELPPPASYGYQPIDFTDENKD